MFGKFTIVISVKYTLQHCQVLSINTLTRQGAMRHRDPVKKPSQAGRPPDEKRIELFDKLCNHIEDNNELVNIMNSFDNDEEFYFSENWLQEKLVSYYGEDIIVVKNPGRTNIICFKSFANKVLRTQ